MKGWDAEDWIGAMLAAAALVLCLGIAVGIIIGVTQGN